MKATTSKHVSGPCEGASSGVECFRYCASASIGGRFANQNRESFSLTGEIVNFKIIEVFITETWPFRPHETLSYRSAFIFRFSPSFFGKTEENEDKLIECRGK